VKAMADPQNLFGGALGAPVSLPVGAR
jgi:hypothetical protein